MEDTPIQNPPKLNKKQNLGIDVARKKLQAACRTIDAFRTMKSSRYVFTVKQVQKARAILEAKAKTVFDTLVQDIQEAGKTPVDKPQEDFDLMP